MFSTKPLALTLALLALAMGAHAQSIEDIAGPWDLKINAMGRDIEMTLWVEEEGDGVAMSFSGEQGAQKAEKAAYADGELSCTLKLGPVEIEFAVKIEDGAFEGKTESQFGDIVFSGKKVSAEEVAARLEALQRFVGDWDTVTEYNEKSLESNMRIDIENGQLAGKLSLAQGGTDWGSGFRVYAHENTLRWHIDIPYVTSASAEVVVTVADDNTFEGKVKSSLGDISIHAKRSEASSGLIPYDDPTAILGDWVLTIEFAGQPGDATLTITEVDDHLHAQLVSVLGELESDELEYKKESETTGTVRIYTQIEALGEAKQIFEFKIDGDSFEGEELTTDGMILVKGKRPVTGEETDQSDPAEPSEEPQE